MGATNGKDSWNCCQNPSASIDQELMFEIDNTPRSPYRSISKMSNHSSAKINFQPIHVTKYKNQFKIIDVDPEIKITKELKNELSIKDNLATVSNHKNIEACNDDEKLLNYKGSQHGLMLTVQICHSFHYPLQISPDDFWIFIMQGFCQHMKLHGEKYRSKLVDFEGKRTLSVNRSDFTKGNPKNDWQLVFEEFTQKIQGFIGKENVDSFIPDFSTTDSLCKTIHHMSLMNATQNFFTYKCKTDCGISKVKLEGSLEDWQNLRKMTEKLNEYDLKWWTKSILEIIDKIIESYKGNVDKDFWKYIFKHYIGAGSGVNPSVDGWIINFIPYLNDKESKFAKRTLAETLQECDTGDKNAESQSNGSSFWAEDIDLTQPGLDTEDLKKSSSGINITPFIWEYNGQEIKMNMISGFAGANLTEDGFVKAKLGWAIAEKQEQPEKKRAKISQMQKTAKE